mgnify:CR=1 FL=1
MSFDDKGNLIPDSTPWIERQFQTRQVRAETHECLPDFLDCESLYPQLNIASVVTRQTPYNRSNEAKKARNAFIKASK